MAPEALDLYREAWGRSVSGDAPGARQLISAGLLTPSPLDGSQYTAVDAREAERRRMEQTLSTVEAAVSAMTAAAQVREVLDEAAGLSRGVEVLDGADAANARIAEVLPETASAYRSAQPGPRPAEVVNDARARDSALARLRPGVQRRGIYHEARRHDPGVVEYVRAMQPLGVQVRTLTGTFPKLMIFDMAHAFVPLVDDGGAAERAQGAVHITDTRVVSFLAAIWDMFWERARVWEAEAVNAGSADDRVTVRQRDIMTQLLAGRTQAQLPERLGVSKTVVQQELQFLRRLAGVETTMQLGPWWVGRSDT
ncbi:hypothetical protein [Streptomyces sp. NPDC088925]|uniref:hypothetical protein n=1 Tax=Streptomyces sp. NPDC088925 TaxID=3365914 RepID=UPI00381E1B19